MRRHPETSSYIVGELDVPRIVKEMVRSHHERYDGAGYPDGLAGEEIPLSARILAVADTLDAITSDRPYRAARPLRAAIGEIESLAGEQFCPAVVAALDACLARDATLGGLFDARRFPRRRLAAVPCLGPRRAHLVDAREAAEEAVARRAQVEPPHAHALLPRQRDRLVEPRVEPLRPVAQRLGVVGGEPLDVLGHEPGALERGLHPRQVERLRVGEDVALGERPDVGSRCAAAARSRG